MRATTLGELQQELKVYVKKKPTDKKWEPGAIVSKINDRKYVVEAAERSFVQNQLFTSKHRQDGDMI
jgi:hypothetical protein